MVQLSHPYMTTGKTTALTRRTFAGNVMSLLFNMLSMFVTAFLPRSKGLLTSWLQSPSAVILEPKKRKSVIVSIVSPSVCHGVTGPDAVILVFWILSQLFHSSLSLSSRGSLVPLHFLPYRWYHLCIWGYRYFSLQSKALSRVFSNTTVQKHQSFCAMQSTSWEMLGWKKHKLESRLLREISITSDMQMIPPLWQKVNNN